MDNLPREQKLAGPEWAAARKRAIATLDPICAICHKYIDVELPMKDPVTGNWNSLAVEIDHIIPRSRGGALYELSNLQMSHNICNRRKGARMDEDYVEQQVTNQVPWSRQW